MRSNCSPNTINFQQVSCWATVSLQSCLGEVTAIRDCSCQHAEAVSWNTERNKSMNMNWRNRTWLRIVNQTKRWVRKPQLSLKDIIFCWLVLPVACVSDPRLSVVQMRSETRKYWVGHPPTMSVTFTMWVDLESNSHLYNKSTPPEPCHGLECNCFTPQSRNWQSLRWSRY
jgi:hypothetical protein